MKLSILIVSYNVRPLLERCLKSLELIQGLHFEVIVVDNDSQDGTKEFLENVNMPHRQSAGEAETQNSTCLIGSPPGKRKLKTKVILLDDNLGFARGNMVAYRHAGGEYVFLLNPDTEVLPGAVEKLVQFLDTHPDVGMVGPKLLNPDRSLQRSVRGFPTLGSQIFVLLKLHHYYQCTLYPLPFTLSTLSHYLLPHFDYSRAQDVDQVMGAALLVRRSVIDRVGFLDSGFRRWFEEVDFCYRVKHAGWRVVYTPDAEIIHAKGASFHQVSSQKYSQVRHSGLDPESRQENKNQKDSFSRMLKKQYFFNQGMLRFFWKNKPRWQSFALFPFFAVSLCGTALLWLAMKLKFPLVKNKEW